jgi:hypothetical protein
VGIGGTLQPVIPVEASPETAKCTLQKTSLSCSKLEQNVSSEQLVFDDTYCSLPEITSVCSVVQKNGPVSCGECLPRYKSDILVCLVAPNAFRWQEIRYGIQSWIVIIFSLPFVYKISFTHLQIGSPVCFAVSKET